MTIQGGNAWKWLGIQSGNAKCTMSVSGPMRFGILKCILVITPMLRFEKCVSCICLSLWEDAVCPKYDHFKTHLEISGSSYMKAREYLEELFTS